jgi:hypothetical protein
MPNGLLAELKKNQRALGAPVSIKGLTKSAGFKSWACMLVAIIAERISNNSGVLKFGYFMCE